MKSSPSIKQKNKLPDYAGKLGMSDMAGIGSDGKPQPGFNDRSSKPQQADPKALYQMPLTKEEQDIMDGKKGPELAKVMKIVVAHGNATGPRLGSCSTWCSGPELPHLRLLPGRGRQ